MDFIRLRVAVMIKDGRQVLAYSEGDINRYLEDGYRLIGFDTEWI